MTNFSIGNYSNIEFLLISLLSIFLGLSLRATLSSVNQKWATTYHFTLTCSILPPVTMSIVTLISSNLALSLGMVGALSIVRFRNPVKSPFELIIFFSLITIGIGSAVNLKISIFLTILINSVIYLFYKIEKLYQKKNKSVFSISFDEGYKINTLEIKSKKNILIIDKNHNLVEKFNNLENKEINYRLIFSNKDELNQIYEKLKSNEDIVNINVFYSN